MIPRIGSRDYHFVFAPSRRLRLNCCVAIAAVMLLGAASSVAHPTGPTMVNVDYMIRNEAVQCFMYFPIKDAATFLDRAIDIDEVKGKGIDGLGEALAAMHHQQNPVTIDGIVVIPTVKRVDFIADVHNRQSPWGPAPVGPKRARKGAKEEIKLEGGTLHLQLVYSTTTPAKQISFVWGATRLLLPAGKISAPQGTPPGLPIAIYVKSGKKAKRTFVTFTEDEPEYIWHRTGEAVTLPSLVLPARQIKMLALPVVSIGAAGLLVILAPLLAFKKKGRKPIVVVVATCVLLAAVAFGYRPIEIESPWDQKQLPDEAEAKQIFRTLHANIYRAFDYINDDAIYDTLAQSVDGPLLDWIYNEVYQGLILQEEGGALCNVESVDVLESIYTPLDTGENEQAAFQIQCRWHVNGKVTHWGHTHERTNEYEAKFVVSERDEKWKIVHAEVLEQKRYLDEEVNGNPRNAPKPTNGGER